MEKLRWTLATAQCISGVNNSKIRSCHDGIARRSAIYHLHTYLLTYLFIYLLTYIHTSIHPCMHTIPYHTIPYHTIPLHYITLHNITYVHNIMYIYIYTYAYIYLSIYLSMYLSIYQPICCHNHILPYRKLLDSPRPAALSARTVCFQC